MAGKNKAGGFDPNIDDFGFDSYDPKSPDIDDKNTAPISRALKGAVEGAKEATLNKDTLLRLIRAAVPSGIRGTIDSVDELAGVGSDLYNSVSSQVLPELNSLKRNARRLMPSVRGRLPNPLAKAIDGLLKDDSPQSSYQEYNPDEESIKGAMRDVFEAERLLQEHYRNEDKAEDLLRNKVTEDRERSNNSQLRSIRDAVTRMANYQDSIAVKRDQKLLELGYRQYFTQRDLLIESKRGNVEILDQLKAIVENSSLPDLAKVKEYQRRQKENSASLMGNMRGRVDDYVQRFRGQLNDRLGREAKRFGMSLRMGLSGVNQLASGAALASSMPGDAMDKYSEGGRIVGGMLGDDSVVGALGNRLARHVRKIPGVSRLNEKLTHFNDNAPELLSEWAKKRSRGIRPDFWRRQDPFDFRDGFGANAINRFKTLIPKFYEGTPEFSANGYGVAKEAVSYDDLSRKSLVEIIPGLLSRIHGEVRAMRTGEPVDREHYDVATGGFMNTRDFRENLRNQLMPKAQTDVMTRNLDSLMKRLTRGGKLTPEASEALRKQLVHNMVLGRRFNAENFAKGKGLDQIDDPAVLRELTAHFRKMFPLNEFGELAGSERTLRRLNNVSTHYQDVRRLVPKFDENIGNMLNAGAREQLRAIGALKMDGRREFLDPAFIVNAVTGQGGNNDQNSESSNANKGGPKPNSRRRRKRGGRGGNAGGSDLPLSGGSDPAVQTEELQNLIDRLSDVADRAEGANPAGSPRPDLNSGPNGYGNGPGRDRAGGIPPADAEVSEDEQSVMDSQEDIYVPGEESPRLTRQGFRAGRYICKTTRKILRSINDIQGPIVDSSGRVLVASSEIASGLITGTGVRLAQLSKRAEQWVNRVDFVSRLIGGRVSNLVDKFAQGMFGLRGKIEDVYVLGMPDPVLTAEKMRQGFYINRYSKKPINTIDDIKGAVEDREGNVVLSDEDYEKGLYLKDGTLIRRSGMVYNLGRFTRWYFGGYYKNLWKLMKAGGRKLKSVASATGRFLLGVPDVYVPGEETPRLLARMLRRGMYLSSKTGKRIYRLSQIDSDVLGPDGEVVLTLDEVKNGLVDKFGKPLRAFLPRAIEKMISIASAPSRLAGRYWRNSQALMGRGARFAGGKAADAAGWAIDKLTGFRKGSWEERRFKREEAEREKAKNGEPKTKEEKKKNPLWGPILMLAGVLKSGVESIMGKLNPLRYLKDILLATRAGGALGDLLGGGKKGKLLGRAARGIGTAARWAGSGLGAVGARVGATALGSAAVSAGGAIATGAGAALTAVGTGLAAAGTAALAVLTSPVTLTAVAVAAVGFGAWWLWKKYGASPDPIQAVRLAEYGIASGDSDTNAKALKLEESLADYVVVNGEKASFKKDLPLKDIFELFKVDTNNNDNIVAFTNWLKYRFRPVFLRFAAKGNELLPGVKVHEQDDKIADGDKPALVRETKFGSESPDYPYNLTDGPQPPAPAVTGTEAIDAAIERVVRKFAKAEREKRERDTTKLRREENESAVTGGKNPLEVAKRLNSKDNAYTTQSKLDKVRDDTIRKNGDVGMALWEAGSSRRIDELAGVRLRTYGLIELDKARVDALLLLEGDLESQLSYKGDGTATLDYSPVKMFELYGPRFQLNVTDWSQRSKWMTWFSDRFIPAYLSFATAVRRCDKSVTPKEAWNKLKAEDQLKVAQAVVAASTTSWFRTISVWTVTDSPWPDYVLNQDSSSTNEAIDSLKARVKQAKVEEERKSKSQPAVGDGLPKYVAPKTSGDKQLASNINNALTNSGVASLNQLAPMPRDSDGGGGNPNAPYSSGGSTGEFGDGAGGQYGTLPDSKGNGWENNKDLIVAVSKMTGVDAGILATFAGIESDFRPKVGAGTSSATGLYQFINSTWKTMLQKYGAKYGIPPGTPPTDARANALMGAEFLRENREGLSQFLGREPTDVDLYAAHFMGLGGARKFMGMNGNAIAAQAMPEAAKANQSIFYANGRARTRDEVMEELNRRVQSKGRKYAGAANALSMGGSAGVVDTDSVSQDTGDLPTDNVVSVAGGDVQSKASGGSDAPPPGDAGKGGYMGSAVPAMSDTATLPTNPTGDLSPSAQNALGTPEAKTRSAVQTAARANAAELVTNKDLADIMSQQLTAQIEIRDLVKHMLDMAQAKSGGANTDTAATGNDKSNTIGRQSTPSNGKSGPINMDRNY